MHGDTIGTQAGLARARSDSYSDSYRNTQHAAGVDLREEPEKGPRLAEPDAARLEEPRALRRGPYEFSDQEFRRLCALVRSELATHAGLDGADLMEHLKCAAARARLRYDTAVLGRVLDLVRPRRRAFTREAPATHWRDRCAHTPTCSTPTQCELRAAKEE